MAGYPVAWGLDIGVGSIKAVKLVNNGGNVSVAEFAVEVIERGDDVDHDMALAQALGDLVKAHDLGKEPVFAALSGKQIYSRTLNLPVINPSTVHKMVELEARQQIPGDFDELLWGYHMSPSTLDDGSYDVSLFAARKDIVETLVAQCRSVGIELAALSVTGLAVYNFVNFDQEFDDDESVIVLDVGAENTDLVVYHGESMWMRNLRVSGDAITNAFMKKFNKTFAEAEELKLQVNQSGQADRILRMIEGNLGELCTEVQRSLGFYKSQNDHANFQNVVVCGNTFRLGVLAEFMADKLGFPIITLVELERIGIAPGIDEDTFHEELQGLSTAIGLGLQGVGVAKADLNLLPKEQQFQRILNAKKWAGVAIFVLLLAVVLANHFIKSARLESYDIQTKKIKKELQSYKDASEAATNLRTEIQPLVAEMDEFNQIGRHRGVVQTVQAGIIKSIETLIANPSNWLPEDVRSPAEGGDPIRQPLYIESIDIPSFSLAQGVYNPLQMPREIIVAVRMPTKTGTDALQKRLSEALRAELEAIQVSSTMQAALGVRAGRLFSKVTAKSLENSQETYIYRDSSRMAEDGSVDEVIDPRVMQIRKATYVCLLENLEPPAPVQPVVEESDDE